MADIEAFKTHIIEAGVKDPEGIHHEFVSLLHGQKLDFDLIPEGELLDEWADMGAATIDLRYPSRQYGKIAVISVANGTNRLVGPITKRLGNRATPLLTEKAADKAVRLTDNSLAELLDLDPEMGIVFEDVGTKGTTSASAIVDIRKRAPNLRIVREGRLHAMNTWQRRPQLEELDAIEAPYSSIVFEPLPSLEPEQCRESGFCAQGWELIERPKS